MAKMKRGSKKKMSGKKSAKAKSYGAKAKRLAPRTTQPGKSYPKGSRLSADKLKARYATKMAIMINTLNKRKIDVPVAQVRSLLDKKSTDLGF